MTIMKTKDKQDEAQRHQQRNYLIQEVRNQLVSHFTGEIVYHGYTIRIQRRIVIQFMSE